MFKNYYTSYLKNIQKCNSDLLLKAIYILQFIFNNYLNIIFNISVLIFKNKIHILKYFLNLEIPHSLMDGSSVRSSVPVRSESLRNKKVLEDPEHVCVLMT